MLEPNTLSKNNENNSSAILPVMNFVSIANIRKRCGRKLSIIASPWLKPGAFSLSIKHLILFLNLILVFLILDHVRISLGYCILNLGLELIIIIL